MRSEVKSQLMPARHWERDFEALKCRVKHRCEICESKRYSFLNGLSSVSRIVEPIVEKSGYQVNLSGRQILHLIQKEIVQSSNLRLKLPEESK